jgi:hypothetical protein
MYMKIAVEIFLIWTALDVVVGIPLWMLIKLRDRREESAVKALEPSIGSRETSHREFNSTVRELPPVFDDSRVPRPRDRLRISRSFLARDLAIMVTRCNDVSNWVGRPHMPRFRRKGPAADKAAWNKATLIAGELFKDMMAGSSPAKIGH